MSINNLLHAVNSGFSELSSVVSVVHIFSDGRLFEKYK